MNAAEELANFYTTFSVPVEAVESSSYYAPPPRSPPPIEVCSTEKFTPSNLNLKRDLSEVDAAGSFSFFSSPSSQTSTSSSSFSGPADGAAADEYEWCFLLDKKGVLKWECSNNV